MPDFSHLLRKPAYEAKKPPELPIGDYQGVIKKYELTERDFGRGEGKVPFVSFHVGLTDWPDDVEEGEREGIELASRRLSRDFSLQDKDLYRLDSFLRSLGLEGSGRTYDELIPEAVGQPVIASVGQFMSKKTNEIGNQIDKLAGLGQS